MKTSHPSVFRRLVPLIFLLYLVLFLFPTCLQAAENASLTALAGKQAGILTGTPQDKIVEASIEDPKFQYYNNFTDLYLALQQGKVDYCVNSTIAFRIMQENFPEFGYIDQTLTSFNIGAIFPKTNSGRQLQAEFNAYLAEIEKDGSLDAIQEYWLYPNEWENIDIPSKGEKGTLHMAVTSAVKPFSFKMNGQFAGFDIAVIAGFCRQSGYGLSIEGVDFSGILSGIVTGKYDLAAGQISWTQERAETVLFSDFYTQQDIVAIVRANDFPNGAVVQDTSNGSSTTEENGSFLSRTKHSLRRNLLEENRWKMILTGLGNTLTITIFGFLLANLIGALFCAMMLSRHSLLRVIADIYSRIMQGTPIVVILMILYYIVFGKSGISGMFVSILGFGISSGAYLAQTFYGAITSIEPGQREAALAIGFTKREAFLYIIFPQALRNMLAGYFSQLISLLKGTAIVGYIAVVDITKTGDIIRSSTFEPFFPLIIVALIYFLIACILLSILKRLQKHLAPKRVSQTAMNGGK